MPRYFGERRGEMYYRRDGKWHHCRDNGRCFDTLEDARRDFDKVCPKAPGAAFLGALFIFLVGVLFLKLAAGLT
jgi:hypothetical protein